MSKKKYSLNGQLEPITTQRDPDIDQIPAPQQPRSKEEIALAKFKLKIQDLIKPDHDDVYLRRWLKALGGHCDGTYCRLADIVLGDDMNNPHSTDCSSLAHIFADDNTSRSYDVDKAEQMYRASMAFREKMHVDTILQKYQQPEVLQKYLTGGFCGHAKDGSPVRIEPYGRLDMKGIMCSVKKSDLEKAKIQQCERTLRDWKAESKKRGYRVDGLTVVFDMAGVSTKMLWRPGLKMYLHLVKVLEDNYPEMMRYLLIINAPGIFPLLYKMCRPLISEDMKKKIHVIGGDYKEYLLKYIDATNLPVCYGGALTDPDGDPTCRTMICYGGEVPKHYYLQTADFQEQMQSAVIPRGEKLNIDVQVDRKGSILKWEFRTEDYDIGFGVFYQSSSGSVPVVQTSRANSHVVSEDGSYICDELGTYTLCFDNSFSWTRNKRIYYSAEVMYADDSLITTEINSLIEQGDWETLSQRYETTHL